MAAPALLYCCENLTETKQHGRRTEAVDMKIFRSVARCTLYDHQTNQVIRDGLNTFT